MASLSNIDKLKLEKLLEMGTGYVLDFTNRSFHKFILNAVRRNVYSDKYAYSGDSKANRLRAFWDKEPDVTVGKLLLEMLEYWRTQKLLNNISINSNEQIIYEECRQVANKLLGKKHVKSSNEQDFLQKEFKDISLESLQLDGSLTSIIEQRLEEIERCLKANAALAVIFLAGSTLEGLLLSAAAKNAKLFNQSEASPKDKLKKVKQLSDWTLNDLINVACEVTLLDEDVKRFSHALRNFRNYIHPHQQRLSGFNPDLDTAKISVQVLKAAIADLSKNKLSKNQQSTEPVSLNIK